MGASVEFRVLGPFEVLRNGLPTGPAGVKRRGVLAVLALRANQPVSTTELIDALWGDDPPRSATNLVQTYVSAWRRALEPEVRDRGGAGRLVTIGSSYVLRMDPAELDVDRFTDAVAEAKGWTAKGNDAAAAARLADGLRLWRGPALADLAELPFHASAASRLEELWAQGLEDWAGAALRCGKARDVIDALLEARHRYPLREQLSALLMWALAQDGRQAEALAAYDQIRAWLAEELGADPGDTLKQMHARVLRQDLALGAASAAIPDGRLPVLTDRFVGRERELAELAKLVDEHRLVSLTGPGGAGKTRLATEFASGLAASGTGSAVVFVDASPLTDAALISDRLARALDVQPVPGQLLADALARSIGSRQLLVLLDNLEHLPGAASSVTELLQLGPAVHVLATSRASLHARGEHVFAVHPLAVGDHDPDLPTSPAVALFADRAAAAVPSFELTAETAPAAAEICRRLDGLPLAIELAASRVRVLPPTALATRLDHSLDLLTEAGGDRPTRHRTLRATIDWSYQLLDPDTRSTFRALAVFRGGWNIPAAAVVTDQPDELTLLNQLEMLIDANLIEPTRSIHDEPRFRMLATLREYALEQLAAAGKEASSRDRHADYVRALAEQAEPHLTGPEQISYLDRLEAERDNIHAASRWLLSTNQVDRAALIASALWRFWHIRAHLQEGRSTLEAVVSAPAANLDPALRARAFNALGSLIYWQADYSTAKSYYQQALAAFTELNSRAGIAETHYNLGFIATFDGEYDLAASHFKQALTQYEIAGETSGIAGAVAGLALVDRMTGDYERARDRAAQSLAEQRQLGDEFGATNTLGLLGSINARMGHLQEAEAALREALIAHDHVGNISGIVWMLHELAATAAERGDDERAVTLSAAADSLGGALGGGITPETLGLTQPLSVARARLSPHQAQNACDVGPQLNRNQAVVLALPTNDSDNQPAPD